MRVIWAMAMKDLRLLVRDRVAFFFAFFFPLIYAIFFGSIFSAAGGDDEKASAMNVIVVDEDQSDESRAFVTTLNDSSELDATTASRAEATDRVRQGKQVAYVVLPKGFGETRRRPFASEPAVLEVGVDPSRRAEAGMLQGLLTKYAFESVQKMFTDRAAMKKQTDEALAAMQADPKTNPGELAVFSLFFSALNAFMEHTAGSGGDDAGGGFGFRGFEPIRIDVSDVVRKRFGPTNAYEVSFPQAIMWGIMGCAAGFGISLVVERTRGTLVRLRIAPISRVHVLGGKALACFLTTFGVAATLLAIGVAAFGIRPHSYLLLVLSLVCTSVAFVGIMMFLSVLGKTEQSAGGIGWAILTVMAMLGGGMVPVFFMPKWMQTLGSISPVKWGIVAMEGAMWRGLTFEQIRLSLVVLIAFGVVFFAVGAKTFRWLDRA